MNVPVYMDKLLCMVSECIHLIKILPVSSSCNKNLKDRGKDQIWLCWYQNKPGCESANVLVGIVQRSDRVSKYQIGTLIWLCHTRLYLSSRMPTPVHIYQRKLHAEDGKALLFARRQPSLCRSLPVVMLVKCLRCCLARLSASSNSYWDENFLV